MGPQLVSLHFAGSGFGQLWKKFHPIRALINGQMGDVEILEFTSSFQYQAQAESALTIRLPTSPRGTGQSLSSTIFASNPGRTLPLEPGRTSPGALEMIMCRASVEPRASRISTPKRCLNRWNI